MDWNQPLNSMRMRKMILKGKTFDSRILIYDETKYAK